MQFYQLLLIINIYMNIKNITLFIFLLTIATPNLVLSVQLGSSFVGETSTLTINIKTSTTVFPLRISLSDDFGVAPDPSCMVAGELVTCTVGPAPSGSRTIVELTSQTFGQGNQYSIEFQVTNPGYAENFQVLAFNGDVAFFSFDIVTIQPNQITCSIVSNQTIVGKASTSTLNLGVRSLPEGSTGQLFVKSASQQVFPNIINANPVCIIDDSQIPCILSEVFGEQILSFSNAPIGKKADLSPVQVIIRTANNPPFNSTFDPITIQIQDQSNKDVEICTLQQVAPTTLQPSTSFEIQNWQSLVGRSSTVQLLLTPYFQPLSNLIVLLVYPQKMIINPNAPITSTSEAINGNTHLSLENITLNQGILEINCEIVNPSSAIPLSLSAYILFNTTHYRQQKSLSVASLVLTTQTITSLTAAAAIPSTLTQTTINITLTTPISITQSANIIINIQLGQIKCEEPLLQSNITTLSVSSCTTNQIILSADGSVIMANNEYWISFGYITHVSTQNNQIEVDVKSLSGHGIMIGSTSLAVSPSVSSFIVLNTNTVYTQLTNFQISQQNITSIPTTIVRIVQIQLPTYVLLSSTTSVASSNAESVIISTEIDQGSNKVVIRVRGRVDVVLNNILNPSHFQGSRVWTITLTDISNNPSSSATSTHTPQYSPTTVGLAVTGQSQTTIQQRNNITIGIEPRLQYDLGNPPTITIEFSASSIKAINDAVCPSCTLLTSTKFTLPYYAVFMEITVQVLNNNNPTDNQLSISIGLGGFTYEVNQISYQLTPITYAYEVNFSGFLGELGQLTINLTTQLGQSVDVTYTGTQNVFTSDEQCLNCNSTYLTITGIVAPFTSANVVVQGRANGVLFASGIVTVLYTCSVINGCQICEDLNGTGTLSCTKCFAQSITNFYLLYQGSCFSSCPASSYADGVLCVSCPALCYLCTASQCLECETPYSLYLQSCVLECPPSYIKNATHCLPRPIVCPQDCINCPADNECSRCDAGFYLLENLCYTECPEGYIIADDNYQCELFIPPEETDYFPFAFVIASILAFLILSVIKCFEKRSLVLGNFIAIASLFEIGTMIMMFSYTFSSISNEPDRWNNDMTLLTQALLFVIIVTKVLLNIIFLVYFLRNIATDENFEAWLQKSQNNVYLYKTMITLSTIFSFQIIRIIYSRLLGLQLFFGRFKTALIFKPVNYFSLAYLVPAICLIVMSVNNIIMQNGYRTSILYSSLEVIIIQIFVLVACIVQSKRGDQQFFDYQIYKVQNQHEEATGSKINITFQQESGGSMHQALNSAYKSKAHHIVEEDIGANEQDWRLKTYHPTISDRDEEEDTGRKDMKKMMKKANQELSPSIFRQKILKDWQKLKSRLPNPAAQIVKKSNERISVSPSNPKRNSKIQRTGSLQKIQIKSPHIDFKNKSLLKKYFYKINEKQGEEGSIQQNEKEQQNQLHSDANTSQDYHLIGIRQNGEKGDVSQIRNNMNSEESYQRSLLEIGSNIKLNRYDEQQIQEQEERQNHERQGYLGEYVSNDEVVVKKRKNRKRIVNKQTQAVYLQRLASSEAHRKNFAYQKRLDDF